MIEIKLEGFVVWVELGKDDYLRGTVCDTHEPIQVRGLNIHELRSDFTQKIAVYKEHCARRGIQPFTTFQGSSTAEIDELDERADSGKVSEEHPLRRHGHLYFFAAKANDIVDNYIEFRDSRFNDVPPHLRLPLDDIVDELRQRTRSPRLSKKWMVPEQTKKLNLQLRNHLNECFQFVSRADPSKRRQKIKFNHGFIKVGRQLQASADEIFLNYRDYYTRALPRFSSGVGKNTFLHRNKLVQQTEQYLLAVSSRLSEMISWAYDELDDIAPRLGGRPRLDWGYDFVAVLADLWRLITDREPSYKPDGLFTRFVEAAWQSGGDNMPEVPWDTVVPRYSREGSESGGKTSPSGN